MLKLISMLVPLSVSVVLAACGNIAKYQPESLSNEKYDKDNKLDKDVKRFLNLHNN